MSLVSWSDSPSCQPEGKHNQHRHDQDPAVYLCPAHRSPFVKDWSLATNARPMRQRQPSPGPKSPSATKGS